MRYETDVNGYITCVVWGCYTPGSTEYNGEIPAGYSTLVEWADNACINAYYIDKNGNLVLDAEREAELKIIYEQQAADYAPVVHKDLYAQQEILESQYLKATAIGKILELTEAKNMATTVKLTNVSPGVIDIIAHGKNMLRDNMEDKTISGLTFSTFKDSGRKRVEISGTATEDVEYTVSGNGVDIIPVFALLKDTDYYLSMSDLECELRCFNGETYEQVYSGTGGVINLPENKKVTHVVVKIPAGTTILKNITPELYYGSEAAEYVLPGKEVKVTRIDLTGHEITDTVNASLTISGGLVILQADGEDRIVAAGNVNLLNGYNMVYASQGNGIEIEYCKNILDVSSLEFLQGKNTASNRFMILEDGSIKAVNGYFSGELNSEAGIVGGWNINEDSLWCNIIPPNETAFTDADVKKMQQYIVGTTTLTSEEIAKYDYNGDGRITSGDVLAVQLLAQTNISKQEPGKLLISSTDWRYPIRILDRAGNTISSFGIDGAPPSKVPQQIADYVVEEGTIDYWEYQKWNSGKIVLKAFSLLTGVVINYSYGSALYRSQTFNYSLPTGMLKTIKNVSVEGNLGGTWGAVANASVNMVNPFLVSPNTNGGISSDYFWTITVEGTWK